MRFEFLLGAGWRGFYSFGIGLQSPGGFEVRREKCVVRDATGLERSFEVERDNLSVPTPTLRPFLRPARAGYIW